jgi:hypothetical protein
MTPPLAWALSRGSISPNGTFSAACTAFDYGRRQRLARLGGSCSGSGGAACNGLQLPVSRNMTALPLRGVFLS